MIVTQSEKERSGHHQVLIVDDDADIRRGTRMRLQCLGYRIIEAADGLTGLETAKAELPDVILLDVRMPGKNGLEVLAELRRCPTTADIPVIMLSASLVDKAKALDGKAQFFLAKPYNGDALKASMAACLS